MYWDHLLTHLSEKEEEQSPGFRSWWQSVKPPSMESKVRSNYQLTGTLGGIQLTQREVECIIEMSLGKSVKEAAYRLNLSPRTVEYYLQNARSKLGCHNKQDMLMTLIQNNALSEIKLEMLRRMVAWVRDEIKQDPEDPA